MKKALADRFLHHLTTHACNERNQRDTVSRALMKVVPEAIKEIRNPLNELITEDEFIAVMNTFKSNATGPDLINNKMISNMDASNRSHLLHLFNLLLVNGFCPDDWKTTNVIPLIKKGKDHEDLDSYRPISITSCLGKRFERILKNRLAWHLEYYNLLPVGQAGFRKGCSTHDHLWDLENAVTLGFNEKKETHCLFLDIKKAYNLVWVTGLLFKLSKARITGHILEWLMNFLIQRKVRVVLDGTLSDEKSISIGVPQGAVLSPLLFTIMTGNFPLARNT